MTIEYVRILWWIGLCFWIGRDVGKTIDIQYREPEGKPAFVTIPNQCKFLFHFDPKSGAQVVLEALLLQIIGYFFGSVECLLFLVLLTFNTISTIVSIADIVFGVYILLIVLGIMVPLHLRYEHNMMINFECDRTTRLMRMLTIYPKRICKVVSKEDDDTFRITLGRFGRKRYCARADNPDQIVLGGRYYAVHSYEKGSPYWTIRDY